MPMMASAQSTFQAKVDKSYSDASLVWGGSIGKAYDGRIKFILDGKGHLALCGIGRTTNIQLSESINDALRGGYVAVKGKKLIKNFRFFAKARKKADLTSGIANCKSTGAKPPRNSKDLQVRYGKATFRN